MFYEKITFVGWTVVDYSKNITVSKHLISQNPIFEFLDKISKDSRINCAICSKKIPSTVWKNSKYYWYTPNKWRVYYFFVFSFYAPRIIFFVEREITHSSMFITSILFCNNSENCIQYIDLNVLTLFKLTLFGLVAHFLKHKFKSFFIMSLINLKEQEMFKCSNKCYLNIWWSKLTFNFFIIFTNSKNHLISLHNRWLFKVTKRWLT